MFLWVTNYLFLIFKHKTPNCLCVQKCDFVKMVTRECVLCLVYSRVRLMIKTRMVDYKAGLQGQLLVCTVILIIFVHCFDHCELLFLFFNVKILINHALTIMQLHWKSTACRRCASVASRVQYEINFPYFLIICF